MCSDLYGSGDYNVEGVTAVPASVGAFGSLTSLELPDGVSHLPASGCTAELAAIEFFRFRCLSGAEVAAGLDLTASVVEVAALLDFCDANPGMSLTVHGVTTPICGNGTIADAVYSHQHTHYTNAVYSRGEHVYEDRAQWGNGEPCCDLSVSCGWYGVVCHRPGCGGADEPACKGSTGYWSTVVEMCALLFVTTVLCLVSR